MFIALYRSFSNNNLLRKERLNLYLIYFLPLKIVPVKAFWLFLLISCYFCNTGHLLAHGNLVRHCADTFLSSEFKDIRMEAVRTCSRLLSPSLHVSLIISLSICGLIESHWFLDNFSVTCFTKHKHYLPHVD